MMGRQPGGHKQLFYSFNLDDHVPPDHLLRGIDQFLDLSELHQHLAPFYSHTGRPSIDPQLLIRMLVVGYCFGIRSERRLCEEVHLNLAYRWFCRLGLEDPVPDHSTFSKNRHGRFRDSDSLRFVFEQVLERCVREGLVGGEGFAIDASLVKADANRQRGVPGAEADWSDRQSISRPVREYLVALDQAEVEKSTPKNISLTDPAAQWTAAWGPAFYAYSANYLIDVAAGIVVDVEATPAHKSDEINATKTMIERVEERFDLKPDRLIGDTNYGTAAILRMDGRREADRAACAGVGHDPTRGRNAIQRRLPMGRTGRPIPLPTGPCATPPMARVQEPAYPRHQGRHHHLSVQSIRLRNVPDESSLLSEYANSEDRSQRP